MDLIAFSIEGYKRFVEPTSVKLHSDLIAFIGPNEAGKSSVLAALGHLNHDMPFEHSEFPRRSEHRPRLRWQLQLNDDDRAALAHLYNGRLVERIEVEKRAPERSMTFYPVAPALDPAPRRQAAATLSKTLPTVRRMSTYKNLNVDFLIEVQSSLESGHPLDDEAQAQLAEELGELEDAAILLERNEVPAAEFSGPDLEDMPAELRLLSVELTNLLAYESSVDPASIAADILKGRLPEFRLLQPADRDLKSEYDLEAQADSPEPALAHLSRLAQLDLVALRREVREGRYADVTTRRKNANKRLREIFAASWNQEAIAVQLETQGALLIVQVSTPHDEGLSGLDERSDGLRWFAALLAFTYGGRDKPILLADEIETHLHYDAQADLVDVLSRQEYTSKVIYTTHSFGCLPNDLGNGVRVAVQTGIGQSALRNGFWSDGAGFSPLLTSMGAAAVTFTPARRAVLGEGPTEAIVLPTLLRQSARRDRLQFQVAPGLSSVAVPDVGALAAEAGHVAYLTDGDPGGLAIGDKLELGGIPRDRIITLRTFDDGSPIEVEDLIDPTAYAAAVDEEIRCWGAVEDRFQPHDLSDTMRTKSVESWCKSRGLQPPDKAAVAQRVVNASIGKDVFDAGRLTELSDLLKRIEDILAIAY